MHELGMNDSEMSEIKQQILVNTDIIICPKIILYANGVSFLSPGLWALGPI